jgi:PAS domain S-box-containing protein
MYAPVLVAVAYYLGARVGFSLAIESQPVSMLWPPNAILLGALLLAPPRMWAVIIGAAFPAHLAVELASDVPLTMVLCWYISNVTQAVLGAALMRWASPGQTRFDNLRAVSVFVICGAGIAPLVASFLDTEFVILNHWRTTGFLGIWRIRFLSNVLAIFTIVPVIVAWGDPLFTTLRDLAKPRLLEAVALTIGLTTLCVVSFIVPSPALSGTPALLYVPLPFLLWAAVRFGPAGTSAALLVFAVVSISGAIRGRGPFIGADVSKQVLSIQVFLIVTYVPLLALAAVIRERTNADSAVRRTNEQLQLALSAAKMGTWEADLAGDLTTLSQQSRDMFGFEESPAYTSNAILDRVDVRDHPVVLGAAQRALEDGGQYEAEFRVALEDDAVRWVLAKGQVIRDWSGRPMRLIGVHTDVTERRLIEAARRNEVALRESEARLRELADAMPQIVWTAKPDGQIDYLNRRWYDLTATDEDVISQDTWLRMMHSEDRISVLDSWEVSVRDGTAFEHELRLLIAETGEYHWHLARALPVRDESGAIQRWYGTATDINAHKRIEEALRDGERRLRALGEELEARVAERTAELNASEERFGKAFRASPVAIAIIRDRDGRLVEMNERWEAMFGVSRQDAIGKTITELDLYPTLEDRSRIASDLATLGFVHELEVDLSNQRRETLRGVIACERVELAGEHCLITMIRDITERRRAEHEIVAQRRQLQHLGRVALLGELSSAIAHELNQPLTAILANARAAQRMLQRERVDHKELHSILGDIASDDLRAGAVIHRVRALLRRGETDPQLVDINEVVAEVLDLAHSDLIQRAVSVTTNLAESMLLIVGDRVQLQQVLLNMIVNGCEAMVDNPRSDRILTISTTTEGDAVRVAVSDRGTGIANAVVDSVFEPFVTSKPHGLGLGLSICRSIVNAHGGRMWAVNNAGRGATFNVSIPQGAAVTLQASTLTPQRREAASASY